MTISRNHWILFICGMRSCDAFHGKARRKSLRHRLAKLGSPCRPLVRLAGLASRAPLGTELLINTAPLSVRATTPANGVSRPYATFHDRRVL